MYVHVLNNLRIHIHLGMIAKPP